MTTIATDGHTMAGDGCSLSANEIVMATDSPKVQRLPDGSLLGCAGNTNVKHLLAEWLGDQSRPFPKLGTFSALHLLPDGSCRYYSEEGRQHWAAVTVPSAIGSGGELALGALLAGKTPAEAIEIAARRDPFTGGKITVETL